MRTYPGIRALALVGAIWIALATGCSTNRTVQPIVTDPAPPPNTPANATKLVAWDWTHFDASYCDLLTDDFVFAFAAGDSAGQPWNPESWTREVERVALQSMLQRGTGLPRLDGLTVYFDAVPVVQPDPRPGKDPRFHKAVRTSVDLTADVDLGSGTIERWRITGNAFLFFVRGDSAAIPHDMIERGFGPDSTRWWLQRWEDETLQIGGGLMRPMPARSATLGGLKSRFVPVLR